MVATFSSMSPALESSERLPELFGQTFLKWGVIVWRRFTTIAGYGKSDNTVRYIFIPPSSSLVGYFALAVFLVLSFFGLRGKLSIPAATSREPGLS